MGIERDSRLFFFFFIPATCEATTIFKKKKKSVGCSLSCWLGLPPAVQYLSIDIRSINQWSLGGLQKCSNIHTSKRKGGATPVCPAARRLALVDPADFLANGCCGLLDFDDSAHSAWQTLSLFALFNDHTLVKTHLRFSWAGAIPTGLWE